MILKRFKTWIAVAAGASSLAACATAPVEQAPPAPAATAPTESIAAVRPQPSEASRALTDFYARIEQNYRAQGLLRVDGGGPDTPVNQRQLVDNFIKIALFEEFSSVGGRMVRTGNATRLHRWEGPVRLHTHFGASTAPANRAGDAAEIARFAKRLARVTGHPISVSNSNPNFHVFIVDEDERRAIGPQLRAISPEIDDVAVRTVQEMRRSTLCLVFSIDGAADGIYEKAVAVIRAEHPDLLRLSCIHEELAQGLGLPNDSPRARPSVFNDDEEFGLLTTHDEHLLQMLYDPRLRPGMTAAQVRPIAQEIASEILGGNS